jgi:hypothetical protein
MEGLLSARQYFNRQTDAEKDLFQRISHLWETVEWDWYRRSPQGMGQGKSFPCASNCTRRPAISG